MRPAACKGAQPAPCARRRHPHQPCCAHSWPLQPRGWHRPAGQRQRMQHAAVGVQGQWARGVTPCCHRSTRPVAMSSELRARAEAGARAGRGLQIWPDLLMRHRKPLSGSRCGGGVAASLSLAHRWRNGRHRHGYGHRTTRLRCAPSSVQLRATGATLEHSSCLAARGRCVSRYLCSADLGHSRTQERGPCFPSADIFPATHRWRRQARGGGGTTDGAAPRGLDRGHRAVRRVAGAAQLGASALA